MRIPFISVLLLAFFVSSGQYPLKSHPYSTQSEQGFLPCKDTFTIFKKHTSYDIGVILPSWLPVVDKNYVGVLEGKTAYNLVDGTGGPHISEEDLPFFHYSHDFCFEIIPDKTDDNRYTNYLPFQVFPKESGNDTVLNNHVECEWECGLGMANKLNPLHVDNDAGRSGGFYSAGHEAGDMIWCWPAVGDWMHVEGSVIWDRGHPPADVEIHPVRFVAIKRALAERLIIGDSSAKFTTRVDIYGNGDGGAVMNNRYDAPKFTNRVNMSSKDYDFTVKIDLPRPSPNAHLKYKMTVHKGDDFTAYEVITLNDDSATAHILIPWRTKDANDLEVYARTIQFYWDEGTGVAAGVPVDIYKIKLTNLRFKYLDELLSKAEMRMFVNVGSDWIFLNDFLGKKGHILTKGLGKTYKHKWALNNEFTVYVPRGQSFRVFMNGWEVDGIDLLFGKLLDPGAICNRKTKRFFRESIFSLRIYMKGCLDDSWGQTSKLHSYDNLGKNDRFTNSPQSGTNDDPCPASKYPLKDRVFLSYTVQKMN